MSVRLATSLLMELGLTRMDSLTVSVKSTMLVLLSREETQMVSAVTLKTAPTLAMEVRELSLRTLECVSVLTSILLTPSATRTAERSYPRLLSHQVVKYASSTL